MIYFRLVLAGVLWAALAAGSPGAPRTTWSVTVLGTPDDPRFTAVVEAVTHWNEQLASLGATLRFGDVSSSPERLPEGVLRELSEAVLARRRLQRPPALHSIRGDVVIGLSSTDLVSVGIGPASFGRAVVVLRRGDLPPLSLPNVARNVVAHELGHVLDLNHNGEPGTLICGPPAACRPSLYRSDTTVFFPLTDAKRRVLAGRWR